MSFVGSPPYRIDGFALLRNVMSPAKPSQYSHAQTPAQGPRNPGSLIGHLPVAETRTTDAGTRKAVDHKISSTFVLARNKSNNDDGDVPRCLRGCPKRQCRTRFYSRDFKFIITIFNRYSIDIVEKLTILTITSIDSSSTCLHHAIPRPDCSR